LAGTEEAKDQLASLGEDVDDFVVQTSSKTQQLIKDYTAVASNAYQGVDVLDSNGNLRNTYEILLDIAKVYAEIQEEDKKAGTNRANALVEAIAGKNRSNIASSILLNPELLESSYESAKTSENAAQNELNSYMESLDAKISQFQNKVQQLESDLISSDFLKGLVDAGTQLINILDLAIDKLGVLPTLIAPIAAFLSVKKNIGIMHKYANQLF
jgi:TP901 family phage tail tape measure protein